MKQDLSRLNFGRALTIISAFVILITISFFKEAEWYDLVRKISFGGFMIGLLLLPDYVKVKKKS